MNVIELKNVSKKYSLMFQKSALVKNLIPGIFSFPISQDFWALQDINLEIKQGDVVGIIGDNGAGKTTLLSLIAGISFPTEGEVLTKGKVYPLLTLGAGFHRELSGEENIYLNGLLLGLQMEEIKRRREEIIEFSELGGFITQPIYTYSSGMLLRLGFAIAVSVEFDILLLDEILAVGDTSFQEKCISKIKEFIKKGKTVVISSQSLNLISDLAGRVILLDKGKVVREGSSSEVISFYSNLRKNRKVFLRGIDFVRDASEENSKIKSTWDKKFGKGKAEILKVDFIGKDGKKDNFETGEPLTISVDAEIREKIYTPHLGIAIFREDYIYCHGPNTKFDGIKIKKINPGKINFQLHYPRMILSKGNYKVSVAIWDEEEKSPYVYHCACYGFKIDGDSDIKDLAYLNYNWYLFSSGILNVKRKLNYQYERLLSNFQEEHLGKTSLYLKKISLYDRRKNIKDIFFTDEYLGLGLNVNNEDKNNKEILLIVMLLKNDGLLIHQTEVALDIFQSAQILLEYPRFPILPGDYIFFCILSDKDARTFFNSHIKRFTVLSRIRDHGIVYMKHKWNIKL